MNEPIETSLGELRTMSLAKLKETLSVMESDFPECDISRRGKSVTCEIREHIYTKFWTHKFHAMVFAEAMVRAVRRYAAEGHPFSRPRIENDDEPHILISWNLTLLASTPPDDLIEAIKSSWNLVWQRANRVLEDSESVLILGKDTGSGMVRLKKIAAILEEFGYYVYIIKEQPNRLGESIIQKVLRYALLSRFVLIENTGASGHLYEVPHVTKMAECITAILQEEEKGATWMFEDAYVRSTTWKKFSYVPRDFRSVIVAACDWAQHTRETFGVHQQQVLPWMKK